MVIVQVLAHIVFMSIYFLEYQLFNVFFPNISSKSGFSQRGSSSDALKSVVDGIEAIHSENNDVTVLAKHQV